MRKAVGILTSLTSQGSQQQREEGNRVGKLKALQNKTVEQFSFASLSICLMGLGLPKNQTPAGHLMTECISELIRHCRDIWTQTADTIHRETQTTVLPFTQG